MAEFLKPISQDPSQNDSTVFQCAQCGLCCRNIKVSADVIHDEFLEEIPGYFALSADQVGLSFFGWEKKVFEDKAKELNKTVTILPCRVVIDQEHGLNIVVSWSLDEDPCPFQDGNRCPIHRDRPLICRHYPVLPTCFSQSCPNIISEDFDETMPNKKKMQMLYGDQYLATLAVIKTHIQITSMLADMRDQGIIRPKKVKSPDPDTIRKLMEGNRTIDVLDFFVECKDTNITKKGVKEFISLYSDPERLAREGHI